MSIKIITTGGTFDKVYFDANSEFHIGEPMVTALLEEANASIDYELESLLRKDSLEIDDSDRQLIHDCVDASESDRILIIHGTDSMVKTAQALQDIPGKTIVLFGAMQPARMRYSDAMFNLGVATAAVQLLSAGVYLAMNGRILDPRTTRKNLKLGKFETVETAQQIIPE